MAQLKKQVFELKGDSDTLNLIELERVDNNYMLLKFSRLTADKENQEEEIGMSIDEYKQFVKVLSNSKFIYGKENTL